MTDAAGPLVLAIETSCDETAAAVVRGDGVVLSNEVASQVLRHRPYGGVVPELASREHNLALRPVIAGSLEQAGIALADVGIIAATAGPGLASSLLIGHTAAKALSLACRLPFYPVNHLEGHLWSPFMGGAGPPRPCVALIVSGGHTLLVAVEGYGRCRMLGTTRDDAAGEAFDKGAKLLGLPYPGGPELDRLSAGGDPEAFAFPRSMVGSGDHDFSFSGLKTSLRYRLEKLSPAERSERSADLCASYQAAIVDILVEKAEAGLRTTGSTCLAVSGGVSRNRLLRTRLQEMARKSGFELLLAEPDFATDNAAMIGFTAALKWRHGEETGPLERDIDPNLKLMDGR